MEAVLHEGETFEKIVYAGKTIKGREFEDCIFKNCDFSNSDFSFNKFRACSFEGCNLSMMKLRGAALNNATFKECKILGVNFGECHDFLFSVRFESCVLDYSSFAEKKMQKTRFISCSLKEASFSQAGLSGSLFDKTDLSGAIFNTTNLTSANFVSAFNYTIDPELNIIKKAVFSLDGVPGLLSKYNITIV